MQWNILKEQIIIATRAAVSQLLSARADEAFYAIALYTDSSAMTVSLAANSEQALQRDWAVVLESEEALTDADYIYARWAFSEWSYSSWCASEFREISKTLRESKYVDFKQFKVCLVSTMVDALKAVIAEGVLAGGGLGSNVIAYVSITDDDQAETLENESAKALNSPQLTSEFLKRYDT